MSAQLAAQPNKIALENQKKGNPESEWGIKGDGDPNIQGFATDISTDVGKKVDFKIATDSKDYRIDIYRLGYYGGDGARKVATIDKKLTSAQVQPHPLVDYNLGLIDCGNWSVSASWDVPADATSGVYIAKLVRQDGTAGESHIPFVVRDDASASNIVFQTADTTWQAYNEWGGASLYFGDVPTNPEDMIAYMPPTCGCGITAIGRASAISYNRPLVTNTSVVGGPHDFIFGAEHSAIRWLEQNGYDVSYISGVDAARSGQLILNHDAYLSVGHDEYWSGEQRTNVEAARDAGVNLAFWSGNEVYWKVRWEKDANGTPYRTMVCYKETWANADVDKQGSTGTWRDTRFAEPGQKPENALTGTMFSVDSYRLDQISVPYDFSKLRFWRNTDIAELKPGETGTLAKNLLGYEWDSDVENGYRPAGLINMSLSTVSVDTLLYDYGNTVGPGTATHSLTMYRAESGALVFGAGTVFWSWGLDSNHTGADTPTDPNVQQAMVNMFADMGIQPTTLDASLQLATQSTDTIKPTSTVTSQFTGSFVEGQRVTINGTAQDTGGGVVAGVEISTDGGLSWFKATGRETWSYNWVAQATGSYTIMSRAVDDSLNLEKPSAGKTLSVGTPTTSSLWSFAARPEEELVYERTPIELGVKFKSSIGGTVSAVRFYKGPLNTRDHTVHLWSATGQLLASGVSTNETASGWQTVSFSQPITIAADTTYVASYSTNGYYSTTSDYFDGTYTRGPLSVDAGGGVFVYKDSAGNAVFPTTSYANSNYWVDVVFDGGTNRAPTAVADTGLSTRRDQVLVFSGSALTANDRDPDGDRLFVESVSQAQNGTVAFDPAKGQVTFTPTAGYSGAAGFTYTVSDGRGGTASATVSLTVTDQGASRTLFDATDKPAGPAQNDGTPLELGMKFTASGSGTISGIRYYKMAGETGSHSASLWSATGALLGTATFANESASGWQTATFAAPITISGNTTYVASYHSNGIYAADGNYFATAKTNGPLTAPASSASGGNGVFAYSGTTVFPTASYAATNYWVDVLYDPASAGANTAPVAGNDNGYAAERNKALVIQGAGLLANDVDPDGDAVTITGVGGATNGTVAFSSQTNAVTFTPNADYVGAASFTYTIADGRGGTATATVGVTVSTPSSTPTTGLFAARDAPPPGDGGDNSSVELGMKFTASQSGTISGLRYYKSARDTGTHTASLWSSTGSLLAQATFANETASGWQTVNFAQPVTISGGTTYVASYHSNGYYVATNNYFATDRTNGSLTAPSGNNGVYAYGTASQFPTASYSSSNYWVDVLYQATTGANRIPTAANDSGYGTTSGTPLTLTAASLLANDTDLDGDVLSVTGVSGGVNGTVAYDAVQKLVTFTPASGYVGPASFSYQISDGKGGIATASVSLDVRQANRAPAATNDGGYTTTVGTPIALAAASLLANDTDADGDTLSITGVSNGVNGTAAWDAQNKRVTFTPTAGYVGPASFAYQIADGKGGAATATVSLEVKSPSTTPAESLFAGATPAMKSVNDPDPVQLGMKFQADVAGSITGIKFYKGANDNGTHVGRLWTASGQLLAQATFTNETAEGWQSVDLAQAVNIAKDTTYVVSYGSNGNYAATGNFFTADVTNGHLRALADGLAGGNGVYAYGSDAKFPTASWNKTNYYVDVAFAPQLATAA